MTDNIISFPGTSKDEPEDRMTADELIEMARGRFDEVIILGSRGEGAQCLSTMPVDEAIYELSRAIHILHNYLDRL